ncbi:MAG: ArsR family transcriptional regulator [Xanthomonadaceae bacterium]|jgi:repressor of nif and glnA expression|nr:ArsR family transcriptional regulator [Xanthomonadaceae bacterium]
MSKTLSERLQEDRRLVILRILGEQISYKANSSVLATALDHFGHAMSRDQVRTELAWLAEQGLVRLGSATPDGSVLLAQLTERGHEVKDGLAIVPGVARPRPGR